MTTREVVSQAIDRELARQARDDSGYWRNGIYDGRLDLDTLVDAVLEALVPTSKPA